MSRRRKQEVKINSTASLEGLMQETYNDACLQIVDAQKSINQLVTSTDPEIVDDYTKIAKEKAGLLKVKDSAIKIKLELAKLQNEIIKNKGNVDETIKEKTGGTVTLNDFSSIRELIKNGGNIKELEDEE